MSPPYLFYHLQRLGTERLKGKVCIESDFQSRFFSAGYRIVLFNACQIRFCSAIR